MRGNSTDHAELERIRCAPCAVCRVDVVYPLVPSLRNPLSGFTHSGAARCSPQQGPRCVEHTPVSLVVHLQAFKAGLFVATIAARMPAECMASFLLGKRLAKPRWVLMAFSGPMPWAIIPAFYATLLLVCGWRSLFRRDFHRMPQRL